MVPLLPILLKSCLRGIDGVRLLLKSWLAWPSKDQNASMAYCSSKTNDQYWPSLSRHIVDSACYVDGPNMEENPYMFMGLLACSIYLEKTCLARCVGFGKEGTIGLLDVTTTLKFTSSWSSLKQETLVSWVKPREQWVRVNTNGARKHSSGVASAGGLIRDSLGRSLNYKHVKLEIDSAMYVQATKGSSSCITEDPLFKEIIQLLHRD
ncbi:unnamed protein product [Dovyalis caffra]|uniref:RNase H type-1 domain-containing protein n=1 Tax=Dovyalis caffra TaxID=77055 RepID=A0AAV1QUM3_9ROSI|nr:unnamed protein product [Dovyalis caffra]